MLPKDLFVIGIGASAGGIQALFDLFSNIEGKPGVAFIIVQHLSRDFKSQMPGLLARYTHLPIFTITDGDAIFPDCIYFMPENTTVKIMNGQLFLTERRAEEIINLAIDTFFFSLAEDAGEKAVGIILSGMGSDGTKGALAIEEAGGIIMVQDPQSSLYDGMTSSAITNNHPDFILYPQEMGRQLLEYIGSKSNDV